MESWLIAAPMADDGGMRLLEADASDDEVLGLCRLWVELVAAGRLEEAIDLLWVPPTYHEMPMDASTIRGQRDRTRAATRRSRRASSTAAGSGHSKRQRASRD
jgi:hypothetical protein